MEAMPPGTAEKVGPYLWRLYHDQCWNINSMENMNDERVEALLEQEKQDASSTYRILNVLDPQPVYVELPDGTAMAFANFRQARREILNSRRRICQGCDKTLTIWFCDDIGITNSAQYDVMAQSAS